MDEPPRLLLEDDDAPNRKILLEYLNGQIDPSDLRSWLLDGSSSPVRTRVPSALKPNILNYFKQNYSNTFHNVQI